MEKLERGWWETDKIYIEGISLEKLADKQDEIVKWINKENKRKKKSLGRTGKKGERNARTSRCCS